jgi:mono/diheme cytochrome c family protein
MRRLLVPALLATALFAAGCGSDSGSGGSGSGSGSSSGGSSDSGGGAADGKALFAGKCGSCHTLAAADTSGTFGPNLDKLKPSEQVVLATIKAGPSAMPAGLYKGAEAAAVAKFVSENAGK